MKRIAPIAATAACLLASACSAEPAAPVILESLTAGDRACYLEATDATGTTQELLASFEICERTALIGQRVILTSRKESIAAESCQGDPECTQREELMLVVEIEAAK